VRALRVLVPAILTLAVFACGGEYPQSSVAPKTDFAESIHSLYGLVTLITLAILIVVWGVLAYIVVRFRARPDAPDPRQRHGHLGMELAWTAIPTVIVIMIAIPTIQTVFATQRELDEGALVVDVIGHQFWWEFRYPNGVVTANELHLPVDVPVSLRMRSADVIHSFWVPMLGGKRDVNPAVAAPPPSSRGGEAAPAEPGGRGAVAFNYLHFTIREPGVYRGQCAEFCGTSHSLMGVRVIAESDAELRAWMADWQGGVAGDTAAAADSALVVAADGAGGGGAARIELGRQTFHSSSCIACHAIQGTNAVGAIGPNLTLLGRRASLVGWLENSPENLVRWITAPREIKPGALMPGVAEVGGNFPPNNLSEEQVRAVSEYLYSLGRQSSPGSGVAPGGAR